MLLPGFKPIGPFVPTVRVMVCPSQESVLLLEVIPCGEFALPLVISQFFAIDTDVIESMSGAKQTWMSSVMREVDGRRTSVLDNQVCLEALLPERT